MNRNIVATTLALLLVAPTMANAVESSVTINLGKGASQTDVRPYDCGAETPLVVTYVNANPNFLAILTVPDETEELLFASVISASGARYASGQWVWWSKGSDASLYDTTLGEDAEAVLTCTEIHDTP